MIPSKQWRRKWQPTPVFLPGDFLGQRSLVSYSPWGCKELGMTERLTHNTQHTKQWYMISLLLGEACWLKLPTLARLHSNHLHGCFTTGGPAKERGTNKPQPTGRVWESSKGNTIRLTTSQNPSLWHPSWLNKACTTRKDSQSERLAKDNLGTNPITIKPCDCKPCGRAVLLASPTLLLSTWVPVPNKISSFVSTCVSSDNSFPSVRQEPSFRPWKGFPFLQHYF